MKNLIPYKFHQNLVLRTPAMPFRNNINAGILEELLNDECFLDAVYLASPVLYYEAIKLKESGITNEKETQKIRVSLIKYYQRMYSRCTPFGIFAGCTVVNWNEGISTVVLDPNRQVSKSRLDMHYLCSLSMFISSVPIIKNRLFYFPNSCIYKVANKLRYIEYKYVNSQRIYQISGVDTSSYIELILEKSAKGITIDGMINILIETEGVSRKDAEDFIIEMISSQILVNELEPTITGQEYINQIFKVLNRVNVDNSLIINKLKSDLNSFKYSLDAIDATKGGKNKLYQTLYKKTKAFGIDFAENKLIQTDLFNTPSVSNISNKHQAELLAALSFLNGLFRKELNQNLKFFATRFKERYEENEMPLLTVLDGEIGIGYPESKAQLISPLLDNIYISSAAHKDEYDIKWDSTQAWLFNKLNESNSQGNYQVEIKNEDIKAFLPHWDDLPPSLPVIFRLLDDETILFENSSGSSASNLLGRFAHGNKEISKMVYDIISEEIKLNPSVIFAEIVHLPQNRVGNILQHPAFIGHEIPFLARSSLNDEKQIAANDLYINVINGRIRLTSKKLGKEIIPRLSTAHNFSKDSLPLYQFLCDLQTQNLRNSFSFNWGTMARHFKFLPRVVFNKVILFEATWQLTKADFEDILSYSTSDNEYLKLFINKWKLPRYLVLADGDNELLLDLDNDFSVESFIYTIRNRNSIILKEFLFSKDSPVKNSKNEIYINQFVASLIKTQEVYQNCLPKVSPGISKPEKNNFFPGNEWIYLKIYCGIQIADTILVNYVQAFVSDLLQKMQIDKWFFVRYNDGHFHLRLRFHLADMKYHALVIKKLSGLIKKLENVELTWKVQMDTYMPEKQRYGHNTICLAESFFFNDSVRQLEFLRRLGDSDNEALRWLWGIKCTDEMMNSFDLTIHQKIVFLQYLRKAYGREFKATKFVLKQVNNEYRIHKNKIALILNQDRQADNEWEWLEAILCKTRDIQIILAREIQQLIQVKELAVDISELLASYIHMNLNRTFPSEARKQEYILYEFLYLHYNSILQKKPERAFILD